MKKITLRVAAAGAVAALFATMAPLSAAFAATMPTWDTTTNGPVYLVDGTSYVQIPADTQLSWDVGAGVVLSGAPVPADLGDYSWATFPTPTAASIDYFPFLSPVGSERTPSTWKMWGDPSTLEGTGASLPSVWPGHFLGGAAAAVKAAGGTYSMGIAYTDSATVGSTHVVTAYYVTVNIDAGTGTWKFSTPPVSCATVNTDIATTTTLAASPLSVEAGSTSILTATVSASKPVTGNVAFFEGATQIGTGAISSGTATKTATVATVGAHTYSAKYVENVVETAACPAKTTDTFQASTSTDLTVTATAAAVPEAPKAPSENSLNAGTQHGATAGYDEATRTAVMSNIEASNEGDSVNVFGYSTPKYLGNKVVTSGNITVDVSTVAAGIHKLVIADPTTGDVLGWAFFTKTDAATSPTFGKTINADVAAQTATDGEFSLTNLSGATVDLVNPALVNGASVVSGELGKFKVTDMRKVSMPGWDLKTDVTQFAKGSDTIEASALGIAPKLVNQAGTGATEPTLGAAQVSGSAAYPWNFATLLGTKFSGVTTYNADLVFTAPAAAPAGTYTSTLTLTLISK